jgi:hypothetical protein
MNPEKYQHGDTTIVATPGRNVRNIEIALFRPGRAYGSGLISLGQQSEELAAQDIASLAKSGIAPEGRRVYASGQGRIILPAHIAAQIDALSLAAHAEAENAEALWHSQLASIKGLAELEAAVSDRQRYAEEFEQMMEDEQNDGVRPPRRCIANLGELSARYPRASAYLLADTWTRATHDVKASAGLAARAAILAGDDYAQAIREMRRTWKEHCDARAWD